MASETISDLPIALNAEPAIVEMPKSRFNKRQIYIALGVVALLGSAGLGYVYWGSADTKAESVSADATASTYVEVPPMIVNLRSSDGQVRYLKLRFIIVAADTGKAAVVKDKLPVILDALQPFLRELRPEDLNGSAAVFRVKEEMMSRATTAIGAGAVRDVLIQDLIQQ